MVLITGARVALRAFEPAEAETVWGWQHDPAVMRWMHPRHPESLAQLRGRFEAAPSNSYDHLQLAIETLDGGELVGLVRLSGAEPEVGDAELDVYIGETGHWGRGLATDAVRTVCRYGFDVMRLHRITLYVVAENEGARAAYRKVGFVEEGRLRETFRSGGAWYDHVVSGLLAGELRDQ